jgi:hypothetical protein
MRCSCSIVVVLLACSSNAPADGSASSESSGDGMASAPSSSDPTSVDTGATTNDDAIIEDVMLPDALACSEQFAAWIAVRNTGLSTWTAADGYALGAVDDQDPLSSSGRVALPDDAAIEPGQTHVFGMSLVAPADAGAVVTDWQMVHEGSTADWFGEIAARDVDIACGPAVRSGPVRLEGRSFADDGGPFVALGTTMMWAAWAYRNDRPRLEANLAYVADQGFHYVRALGVVGDPLAEDYWDGREIEFGWPDYADVIADLTTLAWDEYGLRIEWTFIGDGQVAVPEPAQRDALVDMFVALGDARPDAIVHFELANEYWQNGFGGPEGLDELRVRTADLRDRTNVTRVATSLRSTTATSPTSRRCTRIAISAPRRARGVRCCVRSS